MRLPFFFLSLYKSVSIILTLPFYHFLFELAENLWSFIPLVILSFLLLQLHKNESIFQFEFVENLPSISFQQPFYHFRLQLTKVKISHSLCHCTICHESLPKKSGYRILQTTFGLSPFIPWLIFCECNSYGGIAMHTFGHLIQYLHLGFTL